MKNKFKLLIGSLIMLLTLSVAASAAEPQKIDMGDGFYMITTTKLSDIQLYGGSVTGDKTADVYYSGTYVGSITITATFIYDGSRVGVESKSASASTSNGWSYKSKSATGSGGSATGSCTFYKGSTSKSASVTVYCDKNGNIS